jgi:hypothetical protein
MRTPIESKEKYNLINILCDSNSLIDELLLGLAESHPKLNASTVWAIYCKKKNYLNESTFE